MIGIKLNNKYLNLLLLSLILAMLIVMSLVTTTNKAYADTRIGASTSTNGQYDGSQGRLRQAVDDAVAGNTYTASNGDTIQGSALVKNGVTTDQFTQLTSAQKQQLINDMTSAVQNKQSSDKTNAVANPITNDTVTSWLQDLQQHPGVGSKLLANIMAQIKPDYVSGNRIFAPFAGPINTAIALVAIVTLALLTFTFVCDLCYLNIPMFQSFVVNSMSEGKGGGGRYNNMFVGREALQAVEESENSSNGKSKNPNGIYLKKRFIGVALLGLCLLYLIQGQIFSIVGMLMDLLGGFLG